MTEHDRIRWVAALDCDLNDHASVKDAVRGLTREELNRIPRRLGPSGEFWLDYDKRHANLAHYEDPVDAAETIAKHAAGAKALEDWVREGFKPRPAASQ